MDGHEAPIGDARGDGVWEGGAGGGGEEGGGAEEGGGEGGSPPLVDQDLMIESFVALHASRPRQRSAGWLAGRERTIGSSELAALMGMNPYQGVASTVASKAGLRRWEGGGVACWWGTLFEPAAEALLALETGATLRGTDISVPAGFAGHAGSPDGYCAAWLFSDPARDGAWRLLTTDEATQKEAEGCPRARQTLLLEFKCPYRRLPKSGVPKHYRPQLWSGLALAPIAHRALFVDTVFRKCPLWSLGPGGEYDWDYHRERRPAYWGGAVAWGLTGVYAPLPGRRARASRAGAGAGADADRPWKPEELGGGGDDDAAYVAWQLYAESLGLELELREGAPAAGPVDFGSCEAPHFERALDFAANRGALPFEHVGPCFPDGRGADLRSAPAIGAAVDALAAAPPEGHYLLGVLPWKIFEINYAFEERRPGFLDEVRPLVEKALGQAAAIREAADPHEAFQELFGGGRAAEKSDPEAEAETQAFFDWVAEKGAGVGGAPPTS